MDLHGVVVRRCGQAPSIGAPADGGGAGRVRPQTGDPAAGRGVPDQDVAFVPGAGEPRAVGAPACPVDSTGVPLQDELLLPPCRVPEPDRLVERGTRESRPVGAPAHALNIVAVATEDRELFPAVGVPEPDCAVESGTGDDSPIRASANRPDKIRVTCGVSRHWPLVASQSLTVPSQLDVAIRRLDVAVQDALLVGVLERLAWIAVL